MKYIKNHYTYIYNIKEKDNIQIQDFLKKKYYYSSRLIRQIKQQGRIILNDKEAKIYDVLNNNDELAVILAKEKLDSEPEPIPLEIIYEDYDILVINKQPGIVTHATRSHLTGNLANAIAYHWKNKGINAKIRFINRLDRDTSGIVVIAKNKYAHQYIQQQMLEGKVEKIYWALVEGINSVKEGTIDLPIGRPTEDSIKREVIENGQRSITHYKVIKEFPKHSLIELNLETGRTHQIRVHMKAQGHPIIGDELYNEKKSQYISRQALHAKYISFNLPRTNKRMNFEAQLPKDMIKLISD